MAYSVYTTPVVSPILRGLAKLVLFIMGWRIETSAPTVDKCVVVAGPHTSNWDYVLFLCSMLMLRMDVKVLVKDDLYLPPFRALMRWGGVIPVNRRESTTMAQKLVQLFASKEQMIVIITPEGTRRRVERWKTGFYHIAEGARIPIVLGYIDYRRKCAGFGPVVWPSGDVNRDVANWQAFYDDKTARHPEYQMQRTPLGMDV